MAAFLRSQLTYCSVLSPVWFVVSTKVCSHGQDKISGALTDGVYVEIANDSDSNRPIDFIQNQVHEKTEMFWVIRSAKIV